MSEQVNINVNETNENINITSTEIVEVIDINVGEIIEEVTLNITEEVIQVNINKVTGGGNQDLQSVTDNGNTTTNDIQVENANYFSIVQPSDVGTENKNTGAYTYIGADGVLGLKTANIESTLKNTNVVNSVTLEFPNKPTGIYTIATTEDTSTQVNSDWNATSGVEEILNKPSIPTKTSDLTNDSNFVSDANYVHTDNNFTNTLKTKLDGIADGAEVNVNADWNATSGDALILNKPTIPSLTGYVPYTGATTDLDLGTYNLTADHIALNTNPSGAGFVVGATQWNNTNGSSETLLKGGNVTLKNGVDLVARVVNKVVPNTTLTKAQYQVVRVSGAIGQRLAVNLAQANNDNNSADTLGIVIETIATNQEGFILTVGQLEGINTTGSLQGETWSDGDVLYLSPTTAGRITNIKPTGATGHIVVLGYVEYAHANNGKIYVKIMNGWELDELHNVYISSVADKQLLSYDSATSLWKNKSVTTADIADSTNKRYVTDANLVTIGNTSGTNTGDETGSSIRTKLGISTLSGSNTGDETTATIKTKLGAASTSADGYLTSTDWNTFNRQSYAINFGSALGSLSSSTQYYFGMPQVTATTGAAARRLYIPKSGIIKSCIIYARCTIASSSESWTINIRLNNTTNTTVASVGNTSQDKVFSNTSLNISVVAGDYIELATVTPAWVTNPGSLNFYGTLTIE